MSPKTKAEPKKVSLLPKKDEPNQGPSSPKKAPPKKDEPKQGASSIRAFFSKKAGGPAQASAKAVLQQALFPPGPPPKETEPTGEENLQTCGGCGLAKACKKRAAPPATTGNARVAMRWMGG